MTTTTLRLGLTKQDVSDTYNIASMVNNNADVLDASVGFLAATSGTRPSSPYNGQAIRETDTGKYYVSNGSAPASASWTQLYGANGSFTGSGALTLSGSGSNLTVGGSASITGALLVSANVTLSGTGSNLSVGGSASIAGNLSITSTGGLVIAGDANLYRGAANLLTTDYAFHIGGSLGLLGGTGAAIGLVNATTAPTGNPTNGGIMYAAGGGPFWRDPSGIVTPMLAGFYDNASPTGALAETVPRWMCTANSVEPTGTTTGTVECFHAIWLPAGTKITNISFLKGGTGAGTPTHWFFEILSNEASPVVRGHTADQTTTALPASTLITKPLVTPFTTTYSGTYYIAFYLAATTVGTWNGVGAAVHTDVVGTTTPRIGGRTAAGTLTPGTDGSTTRTFSGNAYQPVYGFAS